jgi:hypothetical protein
VTTYLYVLIVNYMLSDDKLSLKRQTVRIFTTMVEGSQFVNIVGNLTFHIKLAVET